MLRHSFEDTKCRENEAVEAAWLRGPAGLRHEAALHYEAAKRDAEAMRGGDVSLVGPAPLTSRGNVMMQSRVFGGRPLWAKWA